ncbi:MAG: PAS domain S-box protein, partial [Methylococcaceae bacterium]
MYPLIDSLKFNIVIIELDRYSDVVGIIPRIKHINPPASALLGYEQKELINKPLDIIYASGNDAEIWQAALATLTEKSFAVELVTKANNRIKALISLSVLPGQQPKKTELVLLIQDIQQDLFTTNNAVKENLLQCKDVESALAESEERFRQMAEMTGEWLWEQDPHGYYIYSSTAVNQILGFSQGEVLGKHYTEFLTAQDKADQQNYAASHQPFYDLINHHRHKDGHEVITESTGLPIINAEGKVLKWRGVDRDITARKNFQDALIESEQRTRLIIESSLSAIVIMDSSGLITDWNHQAEKMFGWSRNEAIGKRLADLIIPQRYRNDHWQGLQTFLHSGIGPILNQLIEHTGLRRDGSEFPIELSVSPLKLGNAYIFSGFIHNITGRKRLEHRFRQAVESSPNSIIMVNESGKIVMVNAQTETSFGYSRTELIGQPIEILVPERFRSTHIGFRHAYLA